MKVLIFDQAIDVSGWCLKENKIRIASGILSNRLNKKQSVIKRMEDMFLQIKAMIDLYQPNYVIVEDTQKQVNIHTFKYLSAFQGMILAYLILQDIGFYIIPAKTWKAYCEIKSKKRPEQKLETIAYVKLKYEIDVLEDEADAIGIGEYFDSIAVYPT